MRIARSLIVGLLALLVGVALLSAAVAGGATTTTSTTPLTAGVVAVRTNLGFASASGAGTGMVVSPSGEVLTNNHVIRGATAIRVTIPDTGRSYQARVLGYNLTADVALLKLQGASGLQTVALGNSAQVRVGQTVTAIGNAGGTGNLTTTTGEVTAVGRSITVGDERGGVARLRRLIETDAELRPGNSGGPLFNGAGRVIGINTAASTRFVFRSEGSDGFAIPINRAASIAGQIRAGRTSATVHVGPTAFLGVGVASPTSAGGTVNGGVVTEVVTNSPAAQAGLVAGDVITSLGGRAVRSADNLVTLLLQERPGNRVDVGWIDQLGNRQTATVVLAQGPPQ